MTVARPRTHKRRALVLALLMASAFAVEAGHLTWLSFKGVGAIHSEPVEPIVRNMARPDIVDRNGRLLATDVAMPSVYVDPSRVIDRDEIAEKLAGALRGVDARTLLANIQDRTKQFVWVKRGLTPSEAAKVHDLGLPAVLFRDELRRVYPAGEDGGQVLGFVDGENHGVAGMERYIDAQGLAEPTDGAARSDQPPLILALDAAIQHSLKVELDRGINDFDASAAAGLVLDLRTGEVLADVSLPDYPAGNAALSLDPDRADRISAGTFELGSVFKTVTLAMAADNGVLTAGKLFDASQPLQIGNYSIDDFHPTRRKLTAEEVFLHSSNIGAALMAQEVGELKMRAFLDTAGLTGPMTTELGKMAAPQVPQVWSKTSALTIAFGHGIALAPLQFAAAAGGLIRQGGPLQPTFLKASTPLQSSPAVVKPATAEFLRLLLRHNVSNPVGTGKRAGVPGYDVGGKTGTADIAGKGGYGHDGVLSSFLAVWPTAEPRYLSYILLWAPQKTDQDLGQTAAGLTAAPVMGRLIARISPQLGLAPAYAEGGP